MKDNGVGIIMVALGIGVGAIIVGTLGGVGVAIFVGIMRLAHIL